MPAQNAMGVFAKQRIVRTEGLVPDRRARPLAWLVTGSVREGEKEGFIQGKIDISKKNQI